MKARAVGYLFEDGHPIRVNRPELFGTVEEIRTLFEEAIKQKTKNYTGYMFLVEGGKKE